MTSDVIRDLSQDCYKFAFSGFNNEKRDPNNVLSAVPGQAGGMVYSVPSSPKEVIQAAEKDGGIYIGMDLELGLKKYSQYSGTHYPVALYFGRNADGSLNTSSPHWMKRVAGGEWIDKHGDLPVYRPEFMKNPELMRQYRAIGLDESNLGPKKSPPQTYGRYELYGFMLSPNEGIDVGLDVYFNKLSRRDYAKGTRLRELVRERHDEIVYGGAGNLLHTIKNPSQKKALQEALQAAGIPLSPTP